MSKVVYEFSGTLTVLSPLHVGSGHFETRSCVPGKADGTNSSPEVATIVRDARNRAYLPPTTLKGLLRRIAESSAEKSIAGLVGHLFGAVSGAAGEPAGIGAVLLRGASLDRAAQVTEAPYVLPATDGGSELGPGVFIAARTSIDPDSGTAKDAGLFFQEMVAPGSTFRFRALVERSGSTAISDAETAAKAFAVVLRHLTAENGHPIGKGQADGFGRIRLESGSVRVTRRTLDQSGDFAEKPAQVIWEQAPKAVAVRARSGSMRREDLVLVCKGPFIVVDASRKAKPGQRVEGDTTPQIRPQRLSEKLPLLMGTSVSGALRSRAAWLHALQPKLYVRQDSDVESDGADVPTAPVERLFGVTGFRGLLAMERLEVEPASSNPITSVTIDRFSGAPVDNKLFTTEAFVNVRVKLTIALSGRGSIEPTGGDIALFADLVADMRCNGLQLGHGGNKGFGWFKVEEGHHGRQ